MLPFSSSLHMHRSWDDGAQLAGKAYLGWLHKTEAIANLLRAVTYYTENFVFSALDRGL